MRGVTTLGEGCGSLAGVLGGDTLGDGGGGLRGDSGRDTLGAGEGGVLGGVKNLYLLCRCDVSIQCL